MSASFQICEKDELDKNDPRVAEQLVTLARCYENQDKLPKAEECYKRIH